MRKYEKSLKGSNRGGNDMKRTATTKNKQNNKNKQFIFIKITETHKHIRTNFQLQGREDININLLYYTYF